MRALSIVQRCVHVNPDVVIHVVGASSLGEFGWLSSGIDSVTYEFHADVLMLERVRPACFTVVDGYGFSESDIVALKSKTGILARLIDVSSRVAGCEDVIIGIAPSIEIDVSPDLGSVTRLIGFEYALIREEVLGLRMDRLKGPRSDLVVVAIGGGDSQQLEQAFAEQVLSETSCQVALPLGSLTESLMNRLHSSQTRRLRGFERQDFLGLLRECRIAVVGAGVSTLECGCGGVPVISVVVAENQRGYATAHEIRDFAFFVDARSEEHHRVGEIVSSLLSSPRQLSTLEAMGRKAIDGLGSQRVIDRLIRMKEQVS
jgi:spore coat polysaccharide biosynthesis predicted glycosyltransferase SpsG